MSLFEAEFDVAIIGGGVVGCATLFQLSIKGYHCILLEKNQEIMSEASAGNSGMLHTGFDAPLLSLEQQCIKASQKIVFDVINKFNIPFKRCGATLIAWTDEECQKLPTIKHLSHEADINDVNILSLTELYKLEPYIRNEAKGALHVPGECVIDSCLLGLCFANHARLLGSKICTDCEVVEVGDRMLITSKGSVRCKVIINCAGLQGDIVDHLVDINTFRIQPRQGQYCVYSKTASNLLNTIVFPVPTEKSKGQALFNSVYNNLMMGPTAEDIIERHRPSCNAHLHITLNQKAKWLLPKLINFTPIGHYVGLRPATQFKDYQIRTYPQLNWMTVGGIRSTGVSGSLGIAQYVYERLLSDFSLEPEQGVNESLLEMSWRLGDDKKSFIFDDGNQYQILHPMVIYGQEHTNSNL